jgi:hypothetical protein
MNEGRANLGSIWVVMFKERVEIQFVSQALHFEVDSMRVSHLRISGWMLAIAVFAVSIALGMRLRAGFTELELEQKAAAVAGLVVVPAVLAIFYRLRPVQRRWAVLVALAICLSLVGWVCMPGDSEGWALFCIGASFVVLTLGLVAVQFWIVRLGTSMKS